MAKGLVQNATKKQALSYTRVTPNPLGVTTIAAINGRRRRGKKLAAAMNRRRRSMRRNWSEEIVVPRGERVSVSRGGTVTLGGKKRRARKTVSTSSRKTYARARAMLKASKRDLRAARKLETRAARRAANKAAHRASKRQKRERRHARAVSRLPMRAYYESKGGHHRIHGVPVIDVGDGSMVYVPAKANARRNGKNKGKLVRRRASAAKALRARKAALRKKGLLTARIGGRSYQTYLVHGKKGKLKHVARHKLLGFRSESALQKVLQGDDQKAAERLSRKLSAMYKRRQKASARTAKHGDAFTPNRARHTTVRYEEWSHMKANRKKSRRKGKGRSRKSSKMTKAQRRAASKRASRHVKRRRARSAKKKSRRGASKKKSRRMSKKARRSSARRSHKKGRRSAGKRKASRKSSRKSAHKRRGSKKSSRRSSGKKGHRRTKHKKSPARVRAGKRSWAKKSSAAKKAVRAKLRSYAKARKGKKMRRNGSSALAVRNPIALANRHRRHHHHARRNAKRNGKFTMNAWMANIKEALGMGAIATAGFVAHRGVGWVISEKLMSKVGIFQTSTESASQAQGALAPYRRIIAGALVAAGGIPLAEKAIPKQANVVAAGMVVSLLHQVLVTALGQVAPTYAPALAGYGDRSGKAFKMFPGGIGRGPMGEYFLTGANGYGRSPFGEYFLTGANGFGATERAKAAKMAQAAAGYGAYPAYTQAAAGMGGGFGQVMQAAAGFGGGGPPMLSQAAAGVGEYFLTGANGIGEYEQVAPQGQGAGQTVTDEGIIGGDTHAAEHALNIAEGVAGVTDDQGIGIQSIVDPIDVAVPVSDEPGGSRAGILQGQEGIFG